jgi:hypothetical protein
MKGRWVMRGGVLGLFLCPFFVLAAQQPMGRTYYVAPGGNDSASGSKNAPWQTLQRAAKSVRPGDSVLVRPGNYAGFALGWDGPQNGALNHRITFKAEAGAVIDRRNPRSPDGINLESCSYVTIEGFTIKNTARNINRAGIRSGGKSEGVIIRNNTVDGCGTWGIFTSFTTNAVIENNTTSNSMKEHGIYVSNSANHPIIRSNRSFGNRMCGIHCNGDQTQGGTGLIKSALIEKNVIYDNGRKGGSAINLDGAQQSFIQNNLLYDNHSNGISLYKFDGADGSKHNRVINNTIIQAKDARWCINIKGGSTDNTLYNNILYHLGSRGAINITGNSLEGLTSDYNAIVNRFSPDDGDTFIKLDRWQSVTGQDRHSFVSTPDSLFVNWSSKNFHLKFGSPAIGAGTSRFSPSSDLDGMPRPMGKGIDLGAFQFAARSAKTR